MALLRARKLRVRRSRTALGVTAATMAVGCALGTVAAPAGADSPKVVLGANGQNEQLARQIGRPLATHAWGHLNGPVKVGTLVNIETPDRWSSVANARPGSATYAQIVRWADGIRATGRITFVSYHHEPETSNDLHRGTASDFTAAWRNVVNVFRSRGATNARWTLTMSANSYGVSAGDRRAAAKWYPGDSYVDYVGADPYNWYRNCGSGTTWRPLGQIIAPALSFAKARHKGLVLPEFASNEDHSNPGRKAAWIADALRTIVANSGTIRAAFYQNGAAIKGCHWIIDRSDQIAAFRGGASNPGFTPKP